MDHVFDLEGGWSRGLPADTYGPHIDFREYSFLNNSKARSWRGSSSSSSSLTCLSWLMSTLSNMYCGVHLHSCYIEVADLPAAVRDSKVIIEICPSGTAGCSDGITPPVLQDGKLKVQEGLTSEKLISALAPAKVYKVLEFSTMAGAFKNFTDPVDWTKFFGRVKGYTSIWCCVNAHPGHIHYDPWFDIPHTDKFNRQWEEWKPLVLQFALTLQLSSYSHSQAAYFTSAPECGLDNLAVFDGPDAPPWASQLGVCDWGITNYTSTPADSFAGKCLQCKLTVSASSCPSGWSFNQEPRFSLADSSQCSPASQGCLDVPCPAGTIAQAGEAWCGPGRQARARQCTMTDAPPGDCVVQVQALLPGQSIDTTVYAVPASSIACSAYALTTVRTCRANWTLDAGQHFNTCTTLQPRLDASSCPVLAGYSFLSGQQLLDSSEALHYPATPSWSQLPPAMQAQAGQDATALASLCDRSPHCAAFDTTGSAALRSYVPLAPGWAPMPGWAPTTSPCLGTYVKQVSASSCPRVPGFLFMPGLTWATDASVPPCPSCSDPLLLAQECLADATCAGFSAKHGLLRGGVAPAAASLLPFTITPCVGMFVRVRADSQAYPLELEAVDRLLCGDSTYCSTPLQYLVQGGGAGGQMDLTAQLSSSLLVAQRLVRPNPATAQLLPSLPRVRSLALACSPGAWLVGALPLQLLRIMPRLQSLAVTGCGMVDLLPPDLPSLAPPTLRSLDLSQNQLQGPLPAAWSSGLQLSALNLSGNRLQGLVPASWLQLLQEGEGGRSRAGLVLDLSQNNLDAPLPRPFVTAACLTRTWLLMFGSEPMAGAVFAQPTLLLGANPLLEQWAGRYQRAEGKHLYQAGDQEVNMCGSFGYIIAIAFMWGGFALTLTALLVVLLLRRGQRHWSLNLQQHQDALSPSASILIPAHPPAAAGAAVLEAGTAAAAQTGTAAGAKAETGAGAEEVRPGQGPGAGQLVAPTPASQAGGQAELQAELQAGGQAGVPAGHWWAQLWQRPGSRRLVFLLRLLLLAADLALDVRVTTWLAADGAVQEAAVCAAFIALPQVVVAVTVFASILLPSFKSACAGLLAGPLLLAATPLLAPLLALWNVINPDSPLVFWRYLELVEFSVMLLQAPAQSLTQTIIYARHSQMGAGMYLDHALFISSILLSLSDMTISVYKLLRYKHGALARVTNAFSHLDRTRDPRDYHQLHTDASTAADTLSWYEDLRPARHQAAAHHAPPHRGESYTAPAPVGEQQATLNPLLASLRLTSSPPPASGTRAAAGSGAKGSGGVDPPLRRRSLPVSSTNSADTDDLPIGRPAAHLAPPAASSSFTSPSAPFPPGPAPAPSPRPGPPPAAEGEAGSSPYLQRTSFTSQVSRGSQTSVASSTWSTHLPPPPVHPASLHQSSLRLAVASAMDSLASSGLLPGAAPGVVRTSVSASASPRARSRPPDPLSPRGPSQTRTATPFLSNPQGKPPLPRPGSATTPAQAALRVQALPSRSPLGKRGSNTGSSFTTARSSAGSSASGQNPAYGLGLQEGRQSSSLHDPSGPASSRGHPWGPPSGCEGQYASGSPTAWARGRSSGSEVVSSLMRQASGEVQRAHSDAYLSAQSLDAAEQEGDQQQGQQQEWQGQGSGVSSMGGWGAPGSSWSAGGSYGGQQPASGPPRQQQQAEAQRWAEHLGPAGRLRVQVEGAQGEAGPPSSSGPAPPPPQPPPTRPTLAQGAAQRPTLLLPTSPPAAQPRPGGAPEAAASGMAQRQLPRPCSAAGPPPSSTTTTAATTTSQAAPLPLPLPLTQLPTGSPCPSPSLVPSMRIPRQPPARPPPRQPSWATPAPTTSTPLPLLPALPPPAATAAQQPPQQPSHTANVAGGELRSGTSLPCQATAVAAAAAATAAAPATAEAPTGAAATSPTAFIPIPPGHARKLVAGRLHDNCTALCKVQTESSLSGVPNYLKTTPL
ncbi:hypothetical protein QJQ45_019543 [Haematococcus lacustris]|nr:hypothetical protein QJQ45_019543 [Haematococcus lacustris]